MFWRDMGWNEDDEAVEAREGVCNMTDMLARGPSRAIREGQAARPEASRDGTDGKSAVAKERDRVSLMSRAFFQDATCGRIGMGPGEDLLLD